ncbi:MAG: RagB/SusD family nutrient uptake outer membrane protein [Gemmatimonadaceae bacterium]
MRILPVALVACAGVLSACGMFDTDIKNPNAVEEAALDDAASATILAIGLNSAVTRAFTSSFGPYAVTSDELTWVGSRENWGLLDAGDVSDPVNEYTNAAYPLMSEARWLSNYTINKLDAFDKAGKLRNRGDLARTYIWAAITYMTIADMYDDFVLASDRTTSAPPVGEANMAVFYDSASTYLDRALTIATALNATDLRTQALGLRARVKFARAVWRLLKPARTVPANPYINDAAANTDATAALALMASNFRYRLTPSTGNVGTNNFGSEMNGRQELRAGGEYINPDATRNNLTPVAGLAGIKLRDPITNQPDPVIAATIDECCRVASGQQIPMTMVSAKEMQLILAEAALAAGNTAEARTRINTVRSADNLPAWDGVTPRARDMLVHERRVNLFLQGRRLHDLYRFGLKADRWLPASVSFRKACFFPIAFIERQSNLDAPQPAIARSTYCQ